MDTNSMSPALQKLIAMKKDSNPPLTNPDGSEMDFPLNGNQFEFTDTQDNVRLEIWVDKDGRLMINMDREADSDEELTNELWGFSVDTAKAFIQWIKETK